MACTSKTHNFFVSFCCQRCKREVEFETGPRPCLADDAFEDNGDLPFENKNIKCTTCKQEIMMYWHCTPGQEDDDFIYYDDSSTHAGYGYDRLIVLVENIDKEGDVL